MEEGRRGQTTRSSPHASLCAWMYGLWIYFPPPNANQLHSILTLVLTLTLALALTLTLISYTLY